MTATRRQFLQTGLGVFFLASCGTGPVRQAAGQLGTAAPRPGGILRVGAIGKASAITRDPHGTQGNDSDYLIISLLHDALTVPGAKPTVAPRLATAWESEDLRRWHFKLAPNATFHDGRPVTAEDVVWSLRRLRKTPSGAARLPGIEADAIKADGTHAVTLTSEYPNNELPLLLRLTTFVLPKDTTDVAQAPGTGPFKLKSFQNGNATLVRNDSWYGGKPLLDGIEVRMFQSTQAMTNALITGQIDLASNAGPLAARLAQGRPGVQVVRRHHDMSMPIVMRTSDGPFADERVRLALRLAVDREAMVKQALSGYGVIANDVLGTADPAYARNLPQRTRDLPQARRLLSEAGFDLNTTYELYTTEDVPGLAESATLFAGQVREAGVSIKVVKQDSGDFYERTWLKAPLYTTYWGTNDSVVFFAGKTMVSGTGQNEAAWKDPEFDRAYRKAVSVKDQAERGKLLAEMQRIEYDRSGYLLWGMADGIDLAAAHVRGLPTLPGYGRVQLERSWLAT